MLSHPVPLTAQTITKTRRSLPHDDLYPFIQSSFASADAVRVIVYVVSAYGARRLLRTKSPENISGHHRPLSTAGR